MPSRFVLPCSLLLFVLLSAGAFAEPLQLHLRSRHETAPKSGRYHAVTNSQAWEPRETAIVVCDMWDTHTCPNAALRVSQMAPRMNEVLKAARSKGVFIIHCPSNTMNFYKDHPGRKLAQQAPPVKTERPLENWCYLDKEREIALPIDDSDGGCDCERTWKKGDPIPWTRQIATLEIHNSDAITDSAEAFYLMTQRGIKNLIVMGVHTNMCVLGRPFSIRQMVYQGMNVALMRDLTDTMYNPAMKPFVSHFTGTDLVIEHIEKHWCPTLVSGDFLDGKEYRFPADTRPHVVVLLGEEEYNTATTLPKYAAEELGKDYRVSLVFLDEKTKASFPGLDALHSADVLFISSRRRPLPAEELGLIRKYVAAGKPVIGIRTASHAFHLRNQPAPEGLTDWPDIDAVVFGGSYTNHYGHKLKSTVWPLAEALNHPILKGISASEFPGGGGLYQTSPLKSGTLELLRGKVEGVEQPEPVAWTFTRKDGGRSFYTSLGHPDDFDRPELRTLLKNALAYLTEKKQ
jgi:nicotinamidase-related amidase/type 1 glutamine amidotransferase